MRLKAKIDANHSQVVAALRQCGANVLSLAALGAGVPDLLVCFHGQTVLVEVKDGDKPPSARRLTPDQQQFHEQWRGKIYIVNSVEEAVFVLNELRKPIQPVCLPSETLPIALT